MTIPIGSMTANFASSNTTYTAIGMHVTDTGSSNTSKLLHLTSDGESRVTIFKDGGLRISTGTANTQSNTKLFQINDHGQDVISVSRDIMILSGNVVIPNTIIVGAYAEGFAYANTSNSVLILDLTQASVFRVISSNNYISKVLIKGMNGFPGGNEYVNGIQLYPTTSITLIMKNGTTIPSTAWNEQGINWAGSIAPTSPTGNDVYVLTSSRLGNYGSEFWFGIVAGQDFAIQP